MFDIDLWREIFQSINKNRTRSLLSGFTVTFAILLFTILFGLANGLNNPFAEAFVDDAANAMFIRSGTTTKAHKGMQAGRRIQFKNEDYKYIKTDFDDNVEFITSRIYKNVNASYDQTKCSDTPPISIICCYASGLFVCTNYIVLRLHCICPV